MDKCESYSLYFGFIEVNDKNYTRWTYTLEHTRKGHGLLKRWQSVDLHQNNRQSTNFDNDAGKMYVLFWL